ncbi:MAG: hypothetical protein H0X25_20810 [Acidobacteriales bacterium]|nr:hypothetical protein [Terriglobales bacterium]
MRALRTSGFIAIGLCLIYVVIAHGAPAHDGYWALSKADEAGKVYFTLSEHHGTRSMDSSSNWPTSAFQNVDFSKSGRQDVRFAITRDAGTLQCEGFLDNGEGAGVFHFQPNAAYPAQMKALGFPVEQDDQFAMTVHDVSLDFARRLKAENLTGLDTDKLMAFRIHGVDPQFIEDMRTAGVNASDSDELVSFRIHGVTPEMVKQVRQMGYTPDGDNLIAMRIHGATPESIAELKKRGYDHVDLDQLIAFRIHGVSPEFIDQLKSLGYAHPDDDELVSMRIHGVTPEYISDLRSRGMQNLSIEQLISMRIHGL